MIVISEFLRTMVKSERSFYTEFFDTQVCYIPHPNFVSNEI